MADNRPVLALDIGATTMAVGIVDRRGRVVASDRVPTPSGRRITAEMVWRTLDGVIDRVVDQYGRRSFAGVGAGCGGVISWPEGTVSPPNIPSWREFPLQDRLIERFPRAVLRLRGDGVVMAVGEHWRGAGRGVDNLLGIVVSTGVGGGLVLDGRVVGGASGNAGHVGHIIVDPDGPECTCGGYGCLEAIAAAPALVRWARERQWRATQRRRPSARDLSVDAARGHEVAREALRRAGAALGTAVASATALCDLDVVAVGGGVSQAGPLLLEPAEEALRAHAGMEFSRRVRMVPAELGQQAGLVGAAALVYAADAYWSG
ncbi:MAG: ROK family protein [Streptosporangiales bacterium]